MFILGISAFYCEAGAIKENEEILAGAQNQRFTRKKHDPSFPKNPVKFCLKEADIQIKDLDAIVFYDKPFHKFERFLETYYPIDSQRLRSFISAIPLWIKEKLLLKKLVQDELSAIDNFDREKVKLLFPEHHLSHAASVFYPSSFEEAVKLIMNRRQVFSLKGMLWAGFTERWDGGQRYWE